MNRRVVLGLVGVVVLVVFFALRPRPTSSEATPASPPPALTTTPVTPIAPTPSSREPAPVDAGMLDVFVTADGAPVPDAAISAARMVATSAPYNPEWEAPLTATSDATGHAELPAPAGTWVVLVTKAGFAPTTVDVPRPSGEHRTRVEVHLQQGSSLEGRAVDDEGHGLAPAVVRLTPLGERGSRRKNAPLGLREVSVAADGTFRVTGLADGTWRIEGDAEGAGRSEPLELTVPTSERLTLRFRRSGFLDGVVVHADGGVAAAAHVSVFGEGDSTTLETSSGGTFSLERQPGAYRVSARLGELVGTADAVLHVRSGATTSTRLVLTGAGGTLTGTVKRDDGTPVAGARLLASLHNEAGLVAETKSDAAGTWTLRGLARGSYDLEAEAPGLQRGEERGFFLDDGATQTIDLVLARNGRVVGEVVDTRGAPLALRVRLGSRQRSFPNRFALAGADGRFTFDDVPAGQVYVIAERGPRQQSRTLGLTVPPGKTVDAKLVFDDLIPVEVEFDRHACKASGDTVLMAMEPGGVRSRLDLRAPSTTSRLKLELAPGHWQLTSWVAGPDGSTCGGKGSMATLDLESGKTPLRVRLEYVTSRDEVSVTVRDEHGEPAVGASVTLRDSTSTLSMTITDADGVAQLPVPEKGSFTVSAAKQGRSAQVNGVTRSQKSVTLTLQPAARLHLTLENATGASRIAVVSQNEAMVDELRAVGSEVWLDEVVAGVINLTVTATDESRAGKAQVTTTAGQVTEAKVRLETPAKLRGHIGLKPGEGSGAWVELTSKFGIEDVQADSDGSYVFSSLAPGHYEVSVLCPSCKPELFGPKTIDVAPGATLELNFP